MLQSLIKLDIKVSFWSIVYLNKDDGKVHSLNESSIRREVPLWLKRYRTTLILRGGMQVHQMMLLIRVLLILWWFVTKDCLLLNGTHITRLRLVPLTILLMKGSCNSYISFCMDMRCLIISRRRSYLSLTLSCSSRSFFLSVSYSYSLTPYALKVSITISISCFCRTHSRSLFASYGFSITSSRASSCPSREVWGLRAV